MSIRSFQERANGSLMPTCSSWGPVSHVLPEPGCFHYMAIAEAVLRGARRELSLGATVTEIVLGCWIQHGFRLESSVCALSLGPFKPAVLRKMSSPSRLVYEVSACLLRFWSPQHPRTVGAVMIHTLQSHLVDCPSQPCL